MPIQESKPSIKSTRTTSFQTRSESPKKEPAAHEYVAPRPVAHRATTFEGPTQIRRDISPLPAQRVARVPSDNIVVKHQRSQLRPINSGRQETDGMMDPSDDSTFYSSPDKSYQERSASPATSHGSTPSRAASYSNLDGLANGKKAPPPPPPSRAKKPPPPPPPMKRSALSSTTLSYA